MTFNRLVYHEYVEVRADAPIFSQDFIDWMNDHNDGPAVSIDRDSGRGGQGWQQAIEMAKKAIDEMLAREGGMIPPHELIKAQNAKNALDALKATLQSGTPQQKIAALEAAIASARTLAMIPGLGVFGLAVANFALIVLLGVGVIELVGNGILVVYNCRFEGARRLFRLLNSGRHAQTQEQVQESLDNLQEVINCAKGNTSGDPLSYAQMAAADQEETGGTEGWDSAIFNRDGFEEQQSQPCPQCGHNPCICY